MVSVGLQLPVPSGTEEASLDVCRVHRCSLLRSNSEDHLLHVPGNPAQNVAVGVIAKQEREKKVVLMPCLC